MTQAVVDNGNSSYPQFSLLKTHFWLYFWCSYRNVWLVVLYTLSLIFNWRSFLNKLHVIAYVRLSFCTDSGEGGWETKKGEWGESHECSVEVRMGEFSWRETFVQPVFIPLISVTFGKQFTVSDEQRDKKLERACKKSWRNLRNLSEESLERLAEEGEEEKISMKNTVKLREHINWKHKLKT